MKLYDQLVDEEEKLSHVGHFMCSIEMYIA